MTSIKNKFLIAVILVLTILLTPFSFVLNYSIKNAKAFVYDSVVANAREDFDFNSGWTFCKGQGYENNGSSKEAAVAVTYIPNNSAVPVYSLSYTPSYPNEVWENVSLPHTYNDTDTFDDFVEALDSTNKQSLNGERTMYGGTAWYKKSFFVPNEYYGKKVYIEFEAARQTCQIWVNGTQIEGKYLNGFIAFGYDITDALDYGTSQNGGATNQITVLVDNSYPYYVSVDSNGNFVTMYEDDNGVANVSNDTDNPLVWHDSHWQPNYGGLYRNSYLHVTSPLQLTLPLYSFMQTQGTYIYTSDETVEKDTNGNVISSVATINIDSEIANYTNSAQTFSIVARVKDFTGTVVGEVLLSADPENDIDKENQTLANGSLGHFYGSVQISDVKRWSTDYPYLYTVECLIIQNDICVDNNATQIGVRTFRATTDKGFLLNENYIFLNGYGQRPTNELVAVGTAYPDWVCDYTIKLMKDSGANYIRWGHSAGSASAIRASDKYGLIVTQPGVDGEGGYVSNVPTSPVNTALTYTSVTTDIRKSAFRDLVIYFRNSPSILFWELGNQTSGINTSFFATVRGYVNTYDYGGRVVGEDVLNSGTYATTSSKTTRLSTIRNISTATEQYIDVAEATDLGAVNPTKALPIMEGERNRYEARRGVWDRKTAGFENFTNDYSTNNSGYQYLTSEELVKKEVASYYKMISKKLSFMGGANWIFSDSISHARILSEVSRASGEVDAMMLQKETYYTEQVLFNTKVATSHIVGHWNYSNLSSTLTKYVVSRANSVKLFVEYTEGGQTRYDEYIGVRSSELYLFTFTNVRWKAGKIYCYGYDSENNIIPSAYDEVYTHGAVNSLRITNVVQSPNGILANGSDIVYLDIEALDSNNRRCLSFDGEVSNLPVTFTISGENNTCIWLGGYNSGLEDTIRQKSLFLEAGITRVALKTTLTAGNFSVTATMGQQGEYTHTINLSSTAITNKSGPNCSNYNYYLLSQRTEDYDLSSLSEPVFNSIPPVAEIEAEEIPGEESVSAFLTSMEIYSGDSYFETERLAVEKKLYLDEDYEWEIIPRRYSSLNAEYIKMDNSQWSNFGDSELISLTIKQSCSILIMFPAGAQVPNWVETNAFVYKNNCIISNTGEIYNVYERSVVSNEAVQLGGLVESDNHRLMYIIGFCNVILPVETSTSVSEYAREEIISTSTLNNLTGVYGTEDSTLANSTLKAGIEEISISLSDYAVKMDDTVDSKAEYVFYEIPDQKIINNAKFEMTFDYFVYGSSLLTRYARILFNNGTNYDNSGGNSAFRLFINNCNNNNTATNKLYFHTQLGNSTTTNNVSSGTYSAGVWQSYKITIDMQNQIAKLYIYNSALATENKYVQVGSDIDFSTVNKSIYNSQINCIMFATGNNSKQHIAYKNVRIYPTETQVVINSASVYNVSIQGNILNNFDEDSFYYYIREVSTQNPMISASDVVLTVPTGSTYSTVIDPYQNKAIVTVNCLDSSTRIYYFCFSYYSLYETKNSIYFNDAFCYNQYLGQSHGLGLMYQGYSTYMDTTELFDSVPYELCGAVTLMHSNDDFASIFSLKTFENTTVILAVPYYATREIAFASLINNLEDYTDTQEIITTSSGEIYEIFTRTYLPNQVITFDLNDYSNLYISPILCIKSTSDIQNQVFLHDDFKRVDVANNNAPYNWETHIFGNNNSIEYEYDETDSALVFIDRSASVAGSDNDGNTWAKTNADLCGFNYINANFSTQENKFIFTTKIFVTEDENYSIEYVRFWLTYGDLNLSDYGNNDAKTNVALEMYLFDEDTTTKTFNLVVPYWTGKGLNDSVPNPSNISRNIINKITVLSNLKRGTWIDLSITVDCQRHSFVASYEFVDPLTSQTMTQTSNVCPFLRNYAIYSAAATFHQVKFCVDKINNLVIGTSQTRVSHFKVSSMGIEKIREYVVESIHINYDYDNDGVATNTSVPVFNELTSDYMMVLNENNVLPNATDINVLPPQTNSNMSTGSDRIVITMTENKAYFIITVYDKGIDDGSGNETLRGAHVFKLHIYANVNELSDYVSTVLSDPNLILEEGFYTSVSWANFSLALANAQDIIYRSWHVYQDIIDAEDNLRTAYENLVLAAIINSHDIGLEKQLSNDSFVPSESAVPQIYYNQVVTVSFDRTVNDFSVVSNKNKLIFSNPLPVGTILLLADYHYPIVGYYYYIVTANNLTELSIDNNFKVFGFALSFYETTENTVDGELRLVIDFSNAQKFIGTTRVTFALSNYSSAYEEFSTKDYESAYSLSVTNNDERDYMLQTTGNPLTSYYFIDDCEDGYVIAGNNIYVASSNRIQIPTSVTSATLSLKTKLTEQATYNAPSGVNASFAVCLDPGISTGIKTSINESNLVFDSASISSTKEITITIQTCGVVPTNYLFEVEKCTNSPQFLDYNTNDINFDEANSKIVVANTVTAGLYRCKISTVVNGKTLYDYVYFIVR